MGASRHPSVPASFPAYSGRQDVLLFLDAALATSFKSRIVGEDNWWQTSVFEVADSLAGYHPDLLKCFCAMLAGKEVRSGLSAFRVDAD
jgi:hypothetical protein